jgi:hypothetical protein
MKYLFNKKICFKFCFEGMEESGSEGLDEELARRKDTFLQVNLNLKTISD